MTAAGRPGKNIVVRIVRAAVVAYLIVLVLAMIFENALVYFPSKYPDGNWQPAGLQFEDAWITTDDGVKIHGWYVPCDRPVAYVLFAHGNGGNLSHRADIMRELKNRCQVASLFFDYRGYGRSEGSPNEAGILSDARAARKWLAQHARIAEKEIVLMGESLGGGVAVDLAAKDGARALILENTFTSLPDVAAKHYPFLPTRLLMRNRLNSLDKIAHYHGPLLQFHGDGDTIIPYELGTQLHAAANEPKQFVTVPGADHNDGQSPVFYATVAKFLQQLPPPAP